MNIVFVVYNYIDSKIPLQPWLTIDQVACYMSSHGHCVSVITDVEDPYKSEHYEVLAVKSLRGTNSPEILQHIDRLQPDKLIALVTPLTLATSSWYSIAKPKQFYAFVSYPFYGLQDFITAARYVPFSEMAKFARQLLIPGFIWQRKLNQYFAGLISQSERTCEVLSKSLHDANINLIAPGIDLNKWSPVTQLPQSNSDETILIYMGTASDIRGFYLLLDALAKTRSSSLRLKVLARSASKEDVAHLQQQVHKRNISEKVVFKGGWLEQQDLKAELSSASAVVLPFVLVQSDLPVAVMEAVAAGVPVITSDIVGSSYLIKNASIEINAGDVDQLAAALDSLAQDSDRQQELKNACAGHYQKMISWDEMSRQWCEVLELDDD